MVETTHRIPGAPCIALLADSHNRDMSAALASLRARHPDLIFIAGDFVYGNAPSSPDQLKMEESRNAMAFFSGCSSIAPTYASLGNHEWMLSKADFDLIRSTGCTVQDNTWAEHDGVIIGGLSSARVPAYQSFCDSYTGSELYPKPESHTATSAPRPAIDWLDEYSPIPGCHILLCHHPEYYEPYLRDRKIELVLSGHAHGGQWRIFNHGVFAPGQGIWPRYTSGVHDGKLVISRGLSNTAHIPRINNKPELVFIEPG